MIVCGPLFRCDEVIPCVDFGWPDLAPGQDYVRIPRLWPGVDTGVREDVLICGWSLSPLFYWL